MSSRECDGGVSDGAALELPLSSSSHGTCDEAKSIGRDGDDGRPQPGTDTAGGGSAGELMGEGQWKGEEGGEEGLGRESCRALCG